MGMKWVLEQGMGGPLWLVSMVVVRVYGGLGVRGKCGDDPCKELIFVERNDFSFDAARLNRRL